MEGEFTILGKIRKIYGPYERVDLFRLLPGKMRLPKELLLSFLTAPEAKAIGLPTITEESLELHGPCIELSAVGIYQ